MLLDYYPPDRLGDAVRDVLEANRRCVVAWRSGKAVSEYLVWKVTKVTSNNVGQRAVKAAVVEALVATLG